MRRKIHTEKRLADDALRQMFERQDSYDTLLKMENESATISDPEIRKWGKDDWDTQLHNLNYGDAISNHIRRSKIYQSQGLAGFVDVLQKGQNNRIFFEDIVKKYLGKNTKDFVKEFKDLKAKFDPEAELAERIDASKRRLTPYQEAMSEVTALYRKIQDIDDNAALSLGEKINKKSGIFQQIEEAIERVKHATDLFESEEDKEKFETYLRYQDFIITTHELMSLLPILRLVPEEERIPREITKKPETLIETTDNPPLEALNNIFSRTDNGPPLSRNWFQKIGAKLLPARIYEPKNRSIEMAGTRRGKGSEAEQTTLLEGYDSERSAYERIVLKSYNLETGQINPEIIIDQLNYYFNLGATTAFSLLSDGRENRHFPELNDPEKRKKYEAIFENPPTIENAEDLLELANQENFKEIKELIQFGYVIDAWMRQGLQESVQTEFEPKLVTETLDEVINIFYGEGPISEEKRAEIQAAVQEALLAGGVIIMDRGGDVLGGSAGAFAKVIDIEIGKNQKAQIEVVLGGTTEMKPAGMVLAEVDIDRKDKKALYVNFIPAIPHQIVSGGLQWPVLKRYRARLGGGAEITRGIPGVEGEIRWDPQRAVEANLALLKADPETRKDAQYILEVIGDYLNSDDATVDVGGKAIRLTEEQKMIVLQSVTENLSDLIERRAIEGTNSPLISGFGIKAAVSGALILPYFYINIGKKTLIVRHFQDENPLLQEEDIKKQLEKAHGTYIEAGERLKASQKPQQVTTTGTVEIGRDGRLQPNLDTKTNLNIPPLQESAIKDLPTYIQSINKSLKKQFGIELIPIATTEGKIRVEVKFLGVTGRVKVLIDPEASHRLLRSEDGQKLYINIDTNSNFIVQREDHQLPFIEQGYTHETIFTITDDPTGSKITRSLIESEEVPTFLETRTSPTHLDTQDRVWVQRGTKEHGNLQTIIPKDSPHTAQERILGLSEDETRRVAEVRESQSVIEEGFKSLMARESVPTIDRTAFRREVNALAQKLLVDRDFSTIYYLLSTNGLRYVKKTGEVIEKDRAGQEDYEKLIQEINKEAQKNLGRELNNDELQIMLEELMHESLIKAKEKRDFLKDYTYFFPYMLMALFQKNGYNMTFEEAKRITDKYREQLSKGGRAMLETGHPLKEGTFVSNIVGRYEHPGIRRVVVTKDSPIRALLEMSIEEIEPDPEKRTKLRAALLQAHLPINTENQRKFLLSALPLKVFRHFGPLLFTGEENRLLMELYKKIDHDESYFPNPEESKIYEKLKKLVLDIRKTEIEKGKGGKLEVPGAFGEKYTIEVTDLPEFCITAQCANPSICGDENLVMYMTPEIEMPGGAYGAKTNFEVTSRPKGQTQFLNAVLGVGVVETQEAGPPGEEKTPEEGVPEGEEEGGGRK